MLLRLLARSVVHRRRTFAFLALSVAMGGALVSVYGTVSWDAGERLGRVLGAYGANLVLVPRDSAGGSLLAESEVRRLDASPLVAGYAPVLYAGAEAGGRSVELAGIDFPRMEEVYPAWRDVRMEGPGSAVAGVDLARRLGLGRGDVVEVGRGGAALSLRVADVASTGGPEDRRMLLDLRALQGFAGLEGSVSEVHVRTAPGPRPLDSMAREIEGQVAGARAKTVEQVARAEADVLGKVQLLIGLVAAAVLALSALMVMNTVAASMLERREEVALMGALGADRRAVHRQFLAESALGGVAGGLAGFGIGTALSGWVGAAVFDSPLAVRPLLLPAVVGVAVALSVAASALPVARGMRVDPCIALRGE